MKGYSVIFENEDFVAVDKASGVLTIPDRHDENQSSLYKMLTMKYGKIFIVHRLDRDTSGLLLFAKNENTHRFLSQLFEQRKIEKHYLALVRGSMPQVSGTIDEPIGEHPYKKGEMAVVKKGKASVTDYITLEDHGIFSLVDFDIHSGRTHQIRVHAQHIGHPVLCDPLYGDPTPVLLSSFKKKYKLSKNEEQEKPLLSRLALHSYKLIFSDAQNQTHSIEAPLPKDMRALLQQIRKKKA